ncbi:hypothetical protein D9619_002507 [Psilocybe cf. subviscida]|uniref:FAS1 domain-containing protein n=1 Tax=Psilocybe cf. subviscida TaxID=2480587 RepID=A0A8H5AWH6_9AGAR|nr:hypothetical protein D9619_002507 [Psilocybe cf. subviscida]
MRFSTTIASLLLYTTFAATTPSMEEQTAMKAGSSLPEYVPQTTPQPTLADLLTIETSASIFYSYARELELSALLTGTSEKFTVFAPTNKAVMALARKPHEGPKLDVEYEMTEEQFHNRAKRNVEHWVSAHIVPEYPLSFDSNRHDTLLRRKAITFTPISKSNSKDPEWARFTLEDSIKIIGKKEALNGDLYFIDTAISTEQT